MLRFRPRGSPPRPAWRWPDPEQSTPVEDLSKYERTENADDYRHRMTMNLLTLVVALALIGCGLWLTGKIVENRNLQDCFLTGRRNCAPIPLPPRAELLEHDPERWTPVFGKGLSLRSRGDHAPSIIM